MIWTYRELGLDLCGSPDPCRRGLWASIIESLAWPRGSVLFWPFSSCESDRLVVRTDLFWDGVSMLDPAMIVVFGLQAAETLLAVRQTCYGPACKGNRRMLIVPGPDEMLPDNRRAKRVVWEYLRQLKF